MNDKERIKNLKKLGVKFFGKIMHLPTQELRTSRDVLSLCTSGYSIQYELTFGNVEHKEEPLSPESVVVMLNTEDAFDLQAVKAYLYNLGNRNLRWIKDNLNRVGLQVWNAHLEHIED